MEHGCLSSTGKHHSCRRDDDLDTRRSCAMLLVRGSPHRSTAVSQNSRERRDAYEDGSGMGDVGFASSLSDVRAIHESFETGDWVHV